MNKEKAPIYEKMVEMYEHNHISFHVPGHKGGKGLDPCANGFYKQLLALDYTEITGLDDLHYPTGVIKEAQELAADCFGAEETHFLVGGSTIGNLAMISSVCTRDDLLIVQRNVHKSVIHGLMLVGVNVIFLPPRWDEISGIATGVRLEDVNNALERYPKAKGVLLSNPNYYGMGINISPIADAVHSRGIPLLVDEAHGAHFGFHPDLPKSALTCGADAVVQSTHKMLTAMTMGAMLHIQGNLIRRDLIKQRLTMLQSSSPSYPILASLDLCRRWLHIHGENSFVSGLQVISQIRAKIRELPCFCILEHHQQSTAYETYDPFKISLSDHTGTLTGFEIQRELERRKCMVELADPNHVLLLFSLASDKDDADRLYDALTGISKQILATKRIRNPQAQSIPGFPHFLEISRPVKLDLHQNYHEQQIKVVGIAEAVDKVVAEMVVPYPPGIPVLYPGEIITASTAAYLLKLVRSGGRFQGPMGMGEENIRIVENDIQGD